jgi:hypothetical protein
LKNWEQLRVRGLLENFSASSIKKKNIGGGGVGGGLVEGGERVIFWAFGKLSKALLFCFLFLLKQCNGCTKVHFLNTITISAVLNRIGWNFG